MFNKKLKTRIAELETAKIAAEKRKKEAIAKNIRLADEIIRLRKEIREYKKELENIRNEFQEYENTIEALKKELNNLA